MTALEMDTDMNTETFPMTDTGDPELRAKGEAAGKKMLPEAQQTKVLTDFTGDAYRLIFEEGYEHLSDYELSLTSSMHTEEWQEWYERFKPHVESSHREILKHIM